MSIDQVSDLLRETIRVALLVSAPGGSSFSPRAVKSPTISSAMLEVTIQSARAFTAALVLA